MRKCLCVWDNTTRRDDHDIAAVEDVYCLCLCPESRLVQDAEAHTKAIDQEIEFQEEGEDQKFILMMFLLPQKQSVPQLFITIIESCCGDGDAHWICL